jgi:diadenosine tetraphosphate (Ap4A) HIT family hydrolase
MVTGSKSLYTSCILCNIDPERNNTFIKAWDHWKLLINFKQPTLGSALLVLDRHVERMPALSRGEMRELLEVMEAYESAVISAFAPSNFNYEMLANAVRHVHFHAVPRYPLDVRFAGMSWVDENYGRAPVLGAQEKKTKTLVNIIKELQKHL